MPGSAFVSPNRSRARCAATYAPVIAAQRVPPSAWSTSQSSQSVRSPSALKSQTLRSARPIRRWISTVRPSGRPARDAALGALAGRRGQHRVLGGHPALALAAQPARDLLLDRGGAEHDRAPLRVEDRPVRLLEEVRLEVELAELVGPAPVVPLGLRHCGVGAALSAGRGGGAASCGADVDVLDVADRELEEALAHLRERGRVAGRQEPVRALALLAVLDPLASSVSATSRAVSSAEKTSVTPSGRRPAGRSGARSGSACSRGSPCRRRPP